VLGDQPDMIASGPVCADSSTCEDARAVIRKYGLELSRAREAGSFLASVAKSHADTKTSLAFVAGGETVVRLTGRGKGGRNQELALSAARGITGLINTAVFSVGSDGTDGPTDAAGGYCDGGTKALLDAAGGGIY